METNVELHHLNKLKERSPHQMSLLQYVRQEETIAELPRVSKKITAPRGALSFLFPPFLFMLLLSIGTIWLVPVGLDWMVRAVATVICLLVDVSLMSSVDMMVRRWSTSPSLMTQKVPALPRSRNPLRTLTDELGQDTDMFLERLPK